MSASIYPSVNKLVRHCYVQDSTPETVHYCLSLDQVPPPTRKVVLYLASCSAICWQVASSFLSFVLALFDSYSSIAILFLFFFFGLHYSCLLLLPLCSPIPNKYKEIHDIDLLQNQTSLVYIIILGWLCLYTGSDNATQQRKSNIIRYQVRVLAAPI